MVSRVLGVISNVSGMVFHVPEMVFRVLGMISYVSGMVSHVSRTDSRVAGMAFHGSGMVESSRVPLGAQLPSAKACKSAGRLSQRVLGSPLGAHQPRG